MKDPNGNISSSFKDLENGGVEHFKRIFNEDNRTSIVEVVIQATYFPRFVTKKDNARIMRNVSKEEIQYVLHSFQKDKILSLDGWPILEAYFNY